MHDLGLIKSSPENPCLEACPAGFSQSTERLLPALHPELLSGGAERQCLQRLGLYPG